MDVDYLHTAHISLYYTCFCLQYMWLVFTVDLHGGFIAVLDCDMNDYSVVCVVLHQDYTQLLAYCCS